MRSFRFAWAGPSDPPAGWRAAASLLLVSTVCFLAVRVSSFLATVFRFGRPLGVLDLCLGFGTDLAVAAAGGLVLSWAVPGNRSLSPRALGAVWAGAGIFYGALALFYFALGCVFWQWGAFPQAYHFEAVRLAHLSGIFAKTILQLLSLPAVLALAGLVLAAVHFHLRLAGPDGRRALLGSFWLAVVFLGPGALGQWLRPEALDPGSISPLVHAFFPRFTGEPTDDGLDPRIPRPSAAAPAPPAPEIVEPRFEGLAGVSRGKDLIIVVLESVRMQNTSAYGYARKTTPNLDRLAENSVFFRRAYVNQPRSCKAFESLTLGVDPDPRLACMTWTPERFRGAESLFSAFQGQGHEVYFGISHPLETDGYGEFVQILSGGRAHGLVGTKELGPESAPPGANGDDRPLVRHFLSWLSGRREPAAAVLWLMAAHPYYDAPRKTFLPERTPVDRYDNCVWSADAALGELVRGLEASGRADRATLVVLGDHGEMLGEHLDLEHGHMLYEPSLRVPFLIHDRAFPGKLELDSVFQMKDFPKTIFYLMGIDGGLRQSRNALARAEPVPIFFSNVYQDFKLGALTPGGVKFIFRPRLGRTHAFDLGADPGEDRDVAALQPEGLRAAMWEGARRWYFGQLDYLAREFPEAGEPVSAGR